MKKTVATLAAALLTAAAGTATATAQEHVDITPPPGTGPEDNIGSPGIGGSGNTVTDPVTGQPVGVSIGAVASCTQPEDHSQPRFESIALFADRQPDDYGFFRLSSEFDVRDYVIPSHSEMRLQWTNHSTGESGDDIVATHGAGSYRLESGPRYVGPGHVTFTATVTKNVGPTSSSEYLGIAPSVSTSHSGDVILSPCNP